MTRISDMTTLTAFPAAGAFAPVEIPGSTTNYKVDLSGLRAVTPQMFAAAAGLTTLGLGIQDDSAAFVAAIAALRAYALNTSGGGFYKGSPKLFIPAGHYYLGTTAIDISHTLVVEGEGSGQFGPGAGGCTRLRWAAGSNGLRVQHPNTSGNTTVTSTHDGAGGVVLRDLMLQGGFGGTTEGDYHGLVIRNAIKAENLYIRDWQGEGVKAWAGTVTGVGAVGGNASTTMLSGVKVENCRGGFDFRGTDANVCTLINCEPYLCRQWGYLDDNGAGANTVIGMHAATNGQVTGPWPQTQCSHGGNVYAAVWGGTLTTAPSGTTADTANWLYMQAGAPIANTIPAWVSTANTFRAGGDYVTIGSAGVLLDQCYSEGGGFSQFNATTLVVHSAIGDTMYRGGHRIIPQSGGLLIKTTNLYIDPPYGTAGTGGGALAARGFTHTLGDNTSATVSDFTLNLDATSGSGTINLRTTGGTVVAYLNAIASDGVYLNAPATNGWNFRVGATQIASITSAGLGLASGKVFSINSQQVVGARGAAVTRITRAASAGSLPTPDGSITIANAATPTVVELLEYCTELEAKLEELTAKFRAATGHGLIA